jgi:alpha-mannosidase
MIVRLYDSAGRGATPTLTVPGLQEAWRSDLLEERGDPLACSGETIELALKPFEICTVRIARA